MNAKFEDLRAGDIFTMVGDRTDTRHSALVTSHVPNGKSWVHVGVNKTVEGYHNTPVVIHERRGMAAVRYARRDVFGG